MHFIGAPCLKKKRRKKKRKKRSETANPTSVSFCPVSSDLDLPKVKRYSAQLRWWWTLPSCLQHPAGLGSLGLFFPSFFTTPTKVQTHTKWRHLQLLLFSNPSHTTAQDFKQQPHPGEFWVRILGGCEQSGPLVKRRLTDYPFACGQLHVCGIF